MGISSLEIFLAMNPGSPRQMRRRQTPRNPAAISQASPPNTQIQHEASAIETQQSQCATAKGTKESSVSLESGLESGYASQTSLIVKGQNTYNDSCSELSGSAINSRLAALELEVDRLKTDRVKSDGQTTVIKKMPRLGKNKKAFSAGDIHSVTTVAELLKSYSSISSSLHTERKDPMKQVCTSSTIVDYVQEDLTGADLTIIAHKMSSRKGSLPSSGLHKNLGIWDTAISISPVKK